MQKDCISFGKKYESVLSSVSIFKKLFDELNANERDLSLAITEQRTSKTGGHIDSKNTRIGVLVDSCFRLGRTLSLLAKETNNKVLLNDVDISKTEFSQGGEEEVMKNCETVLNCGFEYLAQISELGVNQAQLEVLRSELAALKKIPSTVMVVTNDRKMATNKIKVLIADARVILDKLDDAFTGLVGDQTLVNGWFTIRKIRGRHHVAPKVTKAKE